MVTRTGEGANVGHVSVFLCNLEYQQSEITNI